MDNNFLTPYYAVNITTSPLRDDLMFRVMTEKVIELAGDQEGFLYSEWSAEECSQLIFYWATLEQATAWMNHTTAK